MAMQVPLSGQFTTETGTVQYINHTILNLAMCMFVQYMALARSLVPVWPWGGELFIDRCDN